MKLSNEALLSSLLTYAVTDRYWLGERTLCDVVAEAIDGGTTFVQLREKNLSSEEIVAEAIELQALCSARGVPFVIDDDVDAALRAGADGVHVGQSDMACVEARRRLGPDAIVGVSAQTVEQAVKAEADGADYLGVGAVFPTGSKDDAEDVSHETLKAICDAVSIPVVAIGGITKDNVSDLAGTGICGVAVISAIFGKPDIKQASAELTEATKAIL